MKQFDYVRESLEMVIRECDTALANLAEAEEQVRRMEADTQESIDEGCMESATMYLVGHCGLGIETVAAMDPSERTMLKLESLLVRQKRLLDGDE